MRPGPIVWALMAVLVAPFGAAHEGHEHAGAAVSAPAAPVAARLAWSAPPLELLAVREPRGGLRLYADDYASNAPLGGLRIELSSGTHTWSAVEVEAGTYALAPGLLPNTPVPLRVRVAGEGWDVRFDAVLPAAAKAEETPESSARAPVLAVAGAALLAGALVTAWGWRRHRRGAR